MAPPVTIPTIDISPFLSDPTSGDAHKVVEEVRAACTTFGFLQVVGHGVSRSLQEELFRGAAAFFALPLEEKRKVDRAHPGACGKGFEVIGTQEQQKGLGGDYKEGYYISADVPRTDPVAVAHPYFAGPNRWLPEEIQPYSIFREPAERYLAEMHRLIRVMFRIVAAGMPYGPAVFDEFLSGVPLAVLSPKHYPPRQEAGLGSGPHTDFGALTLLLQDGISGLQVQWGDEWVNVAPNRDAYVVNIGDMLQRWTRGTYKSTVHRVLAPKGETHRYSVPFFFNGNLDTKIAPLDGVREGDKVLTVEEHMVERFMSTFLAEKNGKLNNVEA